jgi:hypothetical protein
MTKAITFAVAIFATSFAQSQSQPPEALVRRIPPVAQQAQPAQQAQQVINLGDVVINVVIAKVQTDGPVPELLIAKFGGKEANATTPRTVTSYTSETRTRTVNINGEKVEQEYTVQVPVTQVVQRKVNFTPTEEQRSVPVSMVQAFDLKGQPVDIKVWTKRLENSTHVLLLKEPINDSNRLNAFYASILREDTLLLFLASKDGPEDILPTVTMVYNVKDLEVWQKDGEELDPSVFVELIKSKVTPDEWQGKAFIVPRSNDSSLIVLANLKTHDELSKFLTQLREDIKKAKEEK